VRTARQADGWHVVFSCELPDPDVASSPLPATGIDLGLKVLLVTADGDEITPPRYYRHAQAAWRRAPRSVARKQKGSHRRRQAVQRLAQRHLHVANQRQRRHFHHHVARCLIRQYGMIAHEALNIQGIARSRLAKSTHDVGWGQFRSILHSKAEGAGVRVIAVPPAYTSQDCSGCGERVHQTRSVRMHVCPSCGLIRDRDENAARTILRLARSLQASTWPTGASVA